jgi:serine protease
MVGRVLRIAALLCCLVLGLGEQTAHAGTTISVPGDQPTIQAALDAATAGDTVLVAPGTYVENLDFGGKDVALTASGGADATTLDANGATGVLLGPGGSISGFTITGASEYFGAAIEVHGAASLISQNVFEGNEQRAGGYGAAIGGNNASPIVERNLFRGNTCDSQFLSGVVAFVNGSSPRIQSNVFVDNPCRAVNMTLPAGAAPVVVNNTIVGNAVGIRVDARVSTTAHTYRNNVVVDNDIGLEVDFGAAPPWDHNLVFGNVVDYSGAPSQTGSNGNVSANPSFVDAAGHVFRLQAGSPAIDAGSNVEIPAVDFAGGARSLDGNGDGDAVADIGAFEAPLTVDAFPPVITVSNLLVDATAPSGAPVIYPISVSDDSDPSPSVSCAPASGSALPIGTTTVGCVATDWTGKSSTATFTVEVRGALDQLTTLRGEVATLQDHKVRKTLDMRLRDTGSAYRAGNLGKACASIADFAKVVASQRGKAIPDATATAWLDDADRIEDVMGCP